MLVSAIHNMAMPPTYQKRIVAEGRLPRPKLDVTSGQQLRVLAVQLLIRQDEVAVRIAIASMNVVRELLGEVAQEAKRLHSVLVVAVRGTLGPCQSEVRKDDRWRSPRSDLS